MVRYVILNALKLSFTGILAIKAAYSSPDDRMILPLCILAVVNFSPLVFLIVLYLMREKLMHADSKTRFGSMFTGKNVKDKNHKAHLYPMLFFWRRTLFAVATVLLFDYPIMQMYSHHLLTMLTLVLLAYDRKAFETQA